MSSVMTNCVFKEATWHGLYDYMAVNELSVSARVLLQGRIISKRVPVLLRREEGIATTCGRGLTREKYGG